MRLPLFFFITTFISSLAWGQIYNSSVVSGTAGAGRASVDVGEAAFMNPGTLVHQRGRQILLSQAKGEFAVSLSENDPEVIFPAAVGYVQKRLDMPNEPVLHDMRLTLAELMWGRVGFGATFHYYQVQHVEEQYQQGNSDIGLIYTPNPNWGLAFVAYDVAGGRVEMPEPFRLKSRMGFGVNWLYQPTMRFRLDGLSAPNNNFNAMTTMLGYEVYFNKWIVGRLGYQDNRYEDRKYASVGLGLDLPKFDINYAFLSELPRNANERHSIDLAVTF